MLFRSSPQPRRRGRASAAVDCPQDRWRPWTGTERLTLTSGGSMTIVGKMSLSAALAIWGLFLGGSKALAQNKITGSATGLNTPDGKDLIPGLLVELQTAGESDRDRTLASARTSATGTFTLDIPS